MTNEERLKFFEENKNLVYAVVFKKYSAHKDKEDLFQEGFIGLWKAVRSFDKTRSTKFSTYACICIDNQIKMFFRKENRIPKDIAFSQLEDYEVENLIMEDSVSRLVEFPKFLDCLDVNEQNLFHKIANGKTQRDLAKDYGVSQPQISRRIKKIKNKLKRSMESDYEK